MKQCSVCGSIVSGNRCTRCGMPFYDDDGIRYHLNETAGNHEKHSPGNRVFSQYMEPRNQKYTPKSKPQVYTKKTRKPLSSGTIVLILVFLMWLVSTILGIE